MRMKNLFRGLVLAVLVGIGLPTFSGCQTAHGFGEDMENAGHEIQKGTQ